MKTEEEIKNKIKELEKCSFGGKCFIIEKRECLDYECHQAISISNYRWVLEETK